MANFTRRRFMQTSAVLAGATLIGPTSRVLGANDRVRAAVIGLKGRGRRHMNGLLDVPGVELAALVDVDEKVLAGAVAGIEKKTGKAPMGTTDIRKVLEDKSIDLIAVATPNHWHALMTIWGAQAGKHVYVEKPMSHDITEGRVAVAAQEKYGVVVQHGTQRRSDAKDAGLAKAIKAGKFGRMKFSYGYCCKPRNGIGFQPNAAPPANLDWDLWRGPAVIDQYHANYVHYNWHWFWPTGNGDLNNQGTHQLDIAHWAIDDDQTHPVKAMALGGRFQWKDQGETPNTMFAMAEYPNGQQVFFNVRNVNYEGYERQVMNEYYFEDGGKISRGKYYAKGSDKPVQIAYEGDEEKPNSDAIVIETGKVTPGAEFGSFINAVRANDPALANGDALTAHYGCTLGHIMNNSYRLGTQVPFNKKAGSFGDNKDATEHFGYLHDIMADGVGVPEEGNEYTVGPMLTFDPESEAFTGDHAKAANKLLKDPNRDGFVIPDAKDV